MKGINLQSEFDFPDEEELVDDDGGYGGEMPKNPSMVTTVDYDDSHIDYDETEDDEYE